MRLTRRINYAASIGFVVIALASCGGGGDGGTTPTAPVDNSVGRIDLSPASPATLVSGTTTTLSATAFTKDNRSLGTTSVAWASSNEAVASVSAGTVTANLVGTAVITATRRIWAEQAVLPAQVVARQAEWDALDEPAGPVMLLKALSQLTPVQLTDHIDRIVLRFSLRQEVAL